MYSVKCNTSNIVRKTIRLRQVANHRALLDYDLLIQEHPAVFVHAKPQEKL